MDASDLPARWRSDAETLRGYGDHRGAVVLERVAAELLAALEERADEELRLAAAAAESGLSVRRLRELIAAGDVPNAGRRGAPRIRRRDLPRRRQQAGTSSPYDPARDAAALAARG